MSKPTSIDFSAPFDVQIAQARAQGVKLSSDYYGLTSEKRAQAFTVSGLAKLDQVQRVADALAKAQAEGQTLRDFQKWAKTQDWQLPKHHLETIYRNAAQTAYQAGHWRDFEENASDRPFLMLDAINDSRVRPSHLALDGVIKPTDDAFWKTHSPPMGHRCLLPTQKVSGKVMLGLKAFYSGKVCQLFGSSGVSLSVTVNHPVLTKNGWVNAGDIKQGDKLVVYRRKIDKPIMPFDVMADVHKNDAPPTIKQVFDSLVSSAGEWHTIPKIAFNLNGDAEFFAGNVDVVAADRVLHNSIKTGLLNLLADTKFIFSAKALIDGISDGSFCSSAAVHESLGPILSQLRKHGLSVFSEHGHISIGFDSVALQKFCDPARTDSMLDFEFFDAIASKIVGDNLIRNDNANSVNTSRNTLYPSNGESVLFGPNLASLLDVVIGSHGVNPEAHADILAAHPGFIEFDDVINNVISDYSGHVYDLQTINGCILSTNDDAKDFYFLSNCRCTLRSLSRAEAMAKGGVTQNAPIEGKADAGWGSKPAEWDKALADLKAAKIAKAHPVLSKAAQQAAKKSRPWAAPSGSIEGDWHDAAFTDSPQWLKDAVAKRGDLLGGVTNALPAGKAHYAHPDSIDMGTFDKTNDRGRSTWRHEYGHAIDRKLTNQNLNGPTPSPWMTSERSHQPDFISAMQKDAKALLKNDTDGMHGTDVAKANVARSAAWSYERNASVDFMASIDKETWLSERFKAAGIDFDDFRKAMKSDADFASKLAIQDQQYRHMRAVVAIELRDAMRFMDAVSGGAHTLESNATFSMGSLGNLSDLIGSATVNKVAGFRSGFGHEDAYYSFDSSQAGECFANLMDLYGHKHRVMGKIAEVFTPNMAGLFRKVVKNAP